MTGDLNRISFTMIHDETFLSHHLIWLSWQERHFFFLISNFQLSLQDRIPHHSSPEALFLHGDKRIYFYRTKPRDLTRRKNELFGKQSGGQ